MAAAQHAHWILIAAFLEGIYINRASLETFKKKSRRFTPWIVYQTCLKGAKR
jgi:hypothetical protein